MTLTHEISLKKPWLKENEPLIFWSMLVLFLAPVWFSSFIPTQDGPAHLLNAYLLKNILTDSAGAAVLGLYEINDNPTPTWFLHLILTGLQFIFSPSVAEKLLVSLLIFSVPAAGRFAAGRIDPTMKPLAWLMFPMTYNHLFYYGFYSMCFSIPCFLFAFGVVLDYLHRGRTYSLLICTTGILLCYVLHIIGLGLLGVAVATLAIGRGVSLWNSNENELVPFIKKRLVPLFMAFVPTIMLMVLFLGEKQSMFKLELDFSHILRRALYLGLSASTFPIRFTDLAAFISVGTLYSLLMLFLLIVMVRRHHLKLGMTRIMLTVFLLFCLMQLFFPQMFLISPESGMKGGGFISHRIALFIPPVFMLFLASCTGSIDAYFKQFRIVLLFTFLVLGFHIANFYHFNGYLKEYVALGRTIQPDTLFMPLHLLSEDEKSIETVQGPFGIPLFWRLDPLLHASSYVAMETGAATLANYEASMGYFPLLFKKGMNPEELGYHDSSLVRNSGDTVTVFNNISNHYQTKDFPLEYTFVWRMPGAVFPKDLARELASSALVAESRHGLLYQKTQAARSTESRIIEKVQK